MRTQVSSFFYNVGVEYETEVEDGASGVFDFVGLVGRNGYGGEC